MTLKTRKTNLKVMYNILKAVKLGYTFGYAKAKRIEYLEDRIRELYNQLLELNQNFSQEKSTVGQELIQEATNLTIQQISKTKQDLAKIRDWYGEEKEDELDIEKARQTPIDVFLGPPLRIQGDTMWYNSPLRDEKTPSFNVSKSKNVWYDFGSGEGSDAIDLYMRMNNCTFITAVKELLKYT
jgi:hypothetical protein